MLPIFSLLIFSYSLFSFKISLIGPIRLEDILIILYFVVFLYKCRFVKSFVLFFYAYFLWTLVCFGLTFFRYGLDPVTSLLFVIRPFEYFLYFYVGYCFLFKGVVIYRIFSMYLVYVCFLIVAQNYGIIPVVSGFTVDRAIANTGGPWELALLMSILAIYFFLNRKYLFFILSVIVLFLTESRITFLSTFFSLLYLSYLRLSKRYFIYAIFVAAFSFLAFSFTPLFERFSSFFNVENIITVYNVFKNGDPVNSQEQYFSLAYGDGLSEILSQNVSDMSALVRFTRWSILLSTLSNDWFDFLFGLGPSFAGKAVDGNYVRLLVENGFIGFSLYVFFIIYILYAVKNDLIRAGLISISITALMIDSFVTFKSMMLFWFLLGYYCRENTKSSKE